MGSWDKIYRDYNKGGEAWATLSEDIHPLFRRFITKSNFDRRCALDIGCGTGKYALYLTGKGFLIDGIDSSPTAIKMTKDAMGKNAGTIKIADMFKFRIAKGRYDLILSVATIHHGKKKDIQNLINKIHSALVGGGKVFITLPDFESSKRWNTFKNNKDLGGGTFSPLSGPEKGLPHSFYTKEEVQNLFSNFLDTKIILDGIGRWIVRAAK